MSLKCTIRYSIFLISFSTSVSFSNWKPAYKNIDGSPMDAGLKLSVNVTFRRRHGRLLNVSYMLNLHSVTTGNCHNFYYKSSSIEVLEFNNFERNLSIYVKMAAITYMKIDQNYRKYIFNKIRSPNLQPIRNNKITLSITG